MAGTESTSEIERLISSTITNRTIRAGLITTRDRDHAFDVIKQAATDAGKDLYHYTVAARRKWNPAKFQYESCGGATPDPTELLRGTQSIRGGAVVIIEDLLATLSDTTGDRNARQQLAGMISSEKPGDGTMIIFLEPPEAESNIPSMLAGAFFRLNIPMPDREEIRAIALQEVVAVLARMGATDMRLAREWSDEFTPELTGLTRIAAANAVRDALSPDNGDFQGAKIYLAGRKRQHLSRELAMEIMDNLAELPLGLEHLYRYLEISRERIMASGRERAKGILLVGPPGTGKTMLAKAAGKFLNLPVVEFRISPLMSSYLGETERRFDQAFQTLEAMSPNITFIDELEKAFSQNGTENDGGTMMRTTGRLLTWLSENQKPNFIIATSNNVSRMDELGLTLTRSGRFDKIFFVDVPSRAIRRRMLATWLAGVTDNHETLADQAADATRRFTGADLWAVYNEALMEAKYRQISISAELLLQEISKKTLRVQALYDSFAPLRSFAELHCEPAGHFSDD